MDPATGEDSLSPDVWRICGFFARHSAINRSRDIGASVTSSSAGTVSEYGATWANGEVHIPSAIDDSVSVGVHKEPVKLRRLIWGFDGISCAHLARVLMYSTDRATVGICGIGRNLL